MSFNKFWKLYLTLLSLIFFAVIGFNVHFNTYGVLRKNPDLVTALVNDRYVKMEHILANKDKYDGFLFGTSRVKTMDTTILGNGVYNLGCDHSTPEEWLYMLKILLESNVKIKEIYIGVDDWFYKDRASEFKNAPGRQLYSTSFYERVIYKCKVLLRVPDRDDIKRIFKSKLRTHGLELSKNGVSKSSPEILNNINANLEEYVKDSRFLIPSYIDDIAKQEPIAITQIKEMKRLCDERNIKFAVFFNTVHATSYMRDDFELMKKAKRDLVMITTYYDFSGLHFISKNNRFWFETSHFLPYIADAELKRVKGEKLYGYLKNFGRLITVDNIEKELKREEAERRNFDFTKHIQNVDILN